MASENTIFNDSASQESIKDAPYHVVFGRSVPAGLFPGANGCFDEESVSDVTDETDTQPEPDPPMSPRESTKLPSQMKPTPKPRRKLQDASHIPHPRRRFSH